MNYTHSKLLPVVVLINNQPRLGFLGLTFLFLHQPFLFSMLCHPKIVFYTLLYICTQTLHSSCVKHDSVCFSPPCVFVSAHGVSSKPAQSSSMWSGLISHLRSSVTVKRRRVHLKSHSDCFLGSEAVDVVAEHISQVKGFEGVYSHILNHLMS